MDKFWQIALSVCGFGAVGAFVFWSLYKQWLRLPIFRKLTSTQTFIVMLIFLGLTFSALVVILVAYVQSPSQKVTWSVTNNQGIVTQGQTGNNTDAPQQNIEIGTHATGVQSNIGGTQIIATHSNVIVGPTTNDLSSTTCKVEAKVNSDIVSRVFFRDTFFPERVWQTLLPTSQELFYEWQVLLSVNETAKDIALELHHLPGDRISIDPTATGVLSEPVQRWYSGFPEPHRSKPDYLLSTAKFSHLSPHTPAATVTIRRFLAKPLLSSNTLIRIKNITASNCEVRPEEVEQAQDAERLQRLAKTLAEHVYQMNETGAPVPLRRDPGDVEEHDIQGTMEVRCPNELCTPRIANRLEGRMGKSPFQYVKERGVQELTQLKEALGELLPCIKEPYEDMHPTNEALILEGCGPVSLSPEEMQRVRSVMEKHGVSKTALWRAVFVPVIWA